VCSTRNVDLVRSLGAHHVIDYTTDDFTEGDERYDVILQVSGTHSPLACRRALGRKGTLVQISGDSPGRWIGALGRMVKAGLVSPFVSQKLTACSVKPKREDLQALAELVEAGSVTPVIERTYPLGDVPEGLMHLEEGHTRGKLAVSVQEQD
jgi:NADPH:quinone reductase-like Zn-dependent oxidoreductase